MVYRKDVPGLPNIDTGKGYSDPLAVNSENVNRHLVGWMSIDKLAESMSIVTWQAKQHLLSFLRENRYTVTYENGVELWSNFHGMSSNN